MKRLDELAKRLRYIFCHRPDEYGLYLDEDGALPLKELFYALAQVDGLRWVRESTLRELIVIGGHTSFKVEGGRLFYEGAPDKPLALPKGPVEPPKLLYYGARRPNYPVILEMGLKVGARGFIPLTQEKETARFIARRRGKDPIIVEIKAREAFEQKGALFYLSGESLYLTKFIPPKFLFGPAPPKERPKKVERPAPKPEKLFMPGSFLLKPPSGVDRRDERDWKKGRREERRFKRGAKTRP